MSSRSLRTAASGMNAQQINIEVISNNIANINTTAFKKNRAEFQDLMYQEIQVNSISSPASGISDTISNKIEVGNGVKPSSTQKLFKQGDLTATNQQLDVAIQGEGFFQVRKADGSYAYTRDGSFKIDANGQMVTAAGYSLDPDIIFSEDTLGMRIARDGTVELETASGDLISVDSIQLVRFLNPGGLAPIGDNLYLETPESGTPLFGVAGSDGFGELHQGYLESSNVEIVEEMIAMITAQRSYEINSKTVKTVEEMMSMANNLKRG
ncbi:MAG: flagellar basal-body rod protein FlgG [Ignavibacteriae bacterium]|jgi:flagellar basal-body rod protein FlgG|nr:flagellar basal-body rod protein FlgG [Ignavibacteriota bacterium]NOG97163.1 flagellar basal-body rod protein FlgG [Ignavibacteriota bacterium]